MLLKIDGSLLDFPRSGITYVRMSEVSHFTVEPNAIKIYIGETSIVVQQSQASKLYNSVLSQLNTYVGGFQE